jgi:hypothetical protein
LPADVAPQPSVNPVVGQVPADAAPPVNPPYGMAPQQYAGYPPYQGMPAAPGPRAPRQRAVSGLAAIVGAIAGTVVFAVALASFYTVSKPYDAPEFFRRYLLMLPPPTSRPAYKLEMILVALVALATVVLFLVRVWAVKVVGPVLSVGVLAVVVGNLIDDHATKFTMALLYSQKESTATWLVGILAVVAGTAALASRLRPPAFIGIVGGVAVALAALSAIPVATAPDFGGFYGLRSLSTYTQPQDDTVAEPSVVTPTVELLTKD